MRRLSVVVGCLILAACAGGDQVELREWMKTAGQGVPAKVPPFA
jgi:Tfp pilus assembly protein PilP